MSQNPMRIFFLMLILYFERSCCFIDEIYFRNQVISDIVKETVRGNVYKLFSFDNVIINEGGCAGDKNRLYIIIDKHYYLVYTVLKEAVVREHLYGKNTGDFDKVLQNIARGVSTCLAESKRPVDVFVSVNCAAVEVSFDEITEMLAISIRSKIRGFKELKYLPFGFIKHQEDPKFVYLKLNNYFCYFDKMALIKMVQEEAVKKVSSRVFKDIEEEYPVYHMIRYSTSADVLKVNFYILWLFDKMSSIHPSMITDELVRTNSPVIPFMYKFLTGRSAFCQEDEEGGDLLVYEHLLDISKGVDLEIIEEFHKFVQLSYDVSEEADTTPIKVRIALAGVIKRNTKEDHDLASPLLLKLFVLISRDKERMKRVIMSKAINHNNSKNCHIVIQGMLKEQVCMACEIGVSEAIEFLNENAGASDSKLPNLREEILDRLRSREDVVHSVDEHLKHLGNINSALSDCNKMK